MQLCLCVYVMCLFVLERNQEEVHLCLGMTVKKGLERCIVLAHRL